MRYHRAILLAAVLSLCWTRAGYAPVGCGTPNKDAFGNQTIANPNPILLSLEAGTTATQLLRLSEIGGASTDNWSASANAFNHATLGNRETRLDGPFFGVAQCAHRVLSYRPLVRHR